MNTTNELECKPTGVAPPAADRFGNDSVAAASGPDLFPLMALLLARVLDLDQPTDSGGSR